MQAPGDHKQQMSVYTMWHIHTSRVDKKKKKSKQLLIVVFSVVSITIIPFVRVFKWLTNHLLLRVYVSRWNTDVKNHFSYLYFSSINQDKTLEVITSDEVKLIYMSYTLSDTYPFLV